MKLALRSKTFGFAGRSCKREIRQERRIRGKMVVLLAGQNEPEGGTQPPEGRLYHLAVYV